MDIESLKEKSIDELNQLHDEIYVKYEKMKKANTVSLDVLRNDMLIIENILADRVPEPEDDDKDEQSEEIPEEQSGDSEESSEE